MATDPEGPGVMGKFSSGQWFVTPRYRPSKFSKWNVKHLCISPYVNVTSKRNVTDTEL